MFHEWSFFDPTDVIFKLEMFNFAQYVVDGVIGKVKIAKSTLATLIYTRNSRRSVNTSCLKQKRNRTGIIHARLSLANIKHPSQVQILNTV